VAAVNLLKMWWLYSCLKDIVAQFLLNSRGGSFPVKIAVVAQFLLNSRVGSVPVE